MYNKSRIVRLYPLLILLMVSSGVVIAQDPVTVDDDGNSILLIDSDGIPAGAINAQLPVYTASELEQFVGPIALYPDNLLAIILPASTYPLQIVLAARFLDQLESDSTLTPDESWDESVIALLNYPEVVQMMNENIQWTWQLGEAVVSQESDVLAAIYSFRELAYAAGNLKSDAFQEVTSGDNSIVITQASETVVYVPYYVPEEVIVYQSEPVYHYYPTAYPVYYYPYAADHHFRSNFFWGVTTAFTIGWWDHHLHVYHHSYDHHPYYGHHYDYGHNYRRRDIGSFNRSYVDNGRRRTINRTRDGSYWRPQRNSGARPNYRSNDTRVYSAGDARTVSNERRGNRRPNNNRGGRIDRPTNTAITNDNRGRQISAESPRRQGNRRAEDRTAGTAGSAFANSTTPATVDRVRSEGRADSRRGNRRPNGKRVGSLDRMTSTAISSNDRRIQPIPESPRRRSNRRATDEKGGPVTNAFANSTSAAANITPAIVDRVPGEGSRAESRIGNQARRPGGSNTARATSNRQRSARTSPTGRQSIIAQSTPSNGAIDRANRRRTAPKPSGRVTAVETGSRAVRQAPTRQRAVPQSRRTEPSRGISRSLAPASSRSTGPSRQSTRSTSSSRSTRPASSSRSSRPSSSSRSARPSSSSRSARPSSSSRSAPSSSRQASQGNRGGNRGRRRGP